MALLASPDVGIRRRALLGKFRLAFMAIGSRDSELVSIVSSDPFCVRPLLPSFLRFSAPFRDPHSAFRKSGRLSEIGICIIRNVMTATAALHKQIERYRIMTGEERLAIALDLHEVSCDIAREGIRHDHPEANPAEVERLLRRRLELTRAG